MPNNAGMKERGVREMNEIKNSHNLVIIFKYQSYKYKYTYTKLQCACV